MNRIALLLLPLLVALLTASGCTLTRPLERQASFIVAPPRVEAQMGAEFSQEIEKQYNLVNDPDAQQWLDDVGAKLVKHSPDTSQEFQFAITSSPQVNAFAIPGGYCYVNQGLIQYADNEAQVVAVIGHEINHVTARHGILRMQRTMGLNWLVTSVAGSFKSAAARGAAMAASQGASFLAMRQYSQTDELHADELGVEAMYKAGWDPREAAEFFRKMQQLSGSEPSFLENFLSTHPASAKRVEEIEEQIKDYNLSQTLTVDSQRFQEIRQRMRQQFGAR